MKLNRIIAFFLAFIMMLTALALASCDELLNPTNTTTTTTTDSSNPEETPGDQGSSGNNENQGIGISEEDLQALKDAIERTKQETSYTVTTTGSAEVNMTQAFQGQEQTEWIQSENTTVDKYAGDKKESKSTTKERTSPVGGWEYSNSWHFYKYTSETDGILYSQDEDGNWYTGSFSYITSSSDSADGYDTKFIKDLESIRDKIIYDETTGVYTIEEIEMQNVIEWFFKADPSNVVSGTAVAYFRNIRFEVRNGYVYSCSYDIESRMDNLTLDFQGERGSFDGYTYQSVASTQTDFGTTVVTLPVVE